MATVTKTVDHGALLANWKTVSHSAVLLIHRTKTAGHGAKLIKTRTVSHGAEIVDSRGSYRGVMTESTRDALTYTYPQDTIFATDQADAPGQYYDGAAWQEAGVGGLTPESGQSRTIHARRIEFPDYESLGLDASAYIDYHVTGSQPVFTIGAPIVSGGDPVVLDLNGDSGTAQFSTSGGSLALGPTDLAISADDTTVSGTLSVGSWFGGKYISAAGRTNGADGDFSTTPPDGAIYVVRNSSTGNVYITARANGAWKSVQIV